MLSSLLLILDIIGGLFGIPLWDLLKVLAVPLTIGGAVPLLSWLQKRRELERESQNAQDAALQAYLGAMSELMIDHQLRTSQWDEDTRAAARQPGEDVRTEEVRKVARARTLTALQMLDGERKRSVVQFLYESDLITRDRGVFTLQGFDLRAASLRGLNLSRAELRETRLSGADLRWAVLDEADMSGASLDQADLRSASLQRTILRDVMLSGADMSGASLDPDDMSGAHLDEIYVIDPDDYSSRIHLESTTMPTGQKYRDWLKDREGSGEVGENSGPSQQPSERTSEKPD